MEKKKNTIQERDWMNHMERQMRGFINREHERFSMRNAKHYARKNNRRNTNCRISQYIPIGKFITKLIRHIH